METDMLANDGDDVLPITARMEAESSAERKWGPGWRSKRLEAHFADLIVRDNEDAPHRDPRFDFWHILLTAPGREAKAAKRLGRANVLIWLPHFTKQVVRRGRRHEARLYAAIPGMLLAPSGIMAIPRRDATLEWAGVRDFIRTAYGDPYVLTKEDVERLRVMEAKLNLPPEAKGALFTLGQKVRFKKDLWASWGEATIFEIASEARIGLNVEKLFGRGGKIYVPASEIEAM